VPDYGDATRLMFVPDGSRVLIAGRRGTGLALKELDGRDVAVHALPASTAALSPDGRTAAVAGFDGRIRLHALPDLREIDALPVPPKREVDALAFSRDGRVLVSATRTEILVWALDGAGRGR
jgi:hypothetical protein